MWRAAILVVRHFAEYLATYDPSTPRLDPKAILRSQQQPPPYIFTERETGHLLCETTGFRGRHPVSNASLRTMIGLAACTGLRPGEVMGLDQADVDLNTGVLVIRHTKFDKERLVPVHTTALNVLRAHAGDRDRMPGADAEKAFFLNARGRRYQSDNLAYLMRRLVRRVSLHPPCGKMPTFHSLRHTFAVHRLVAWYRAGQDVQALLPRPGDLPGSCSLLKHKLLPDGDRRDAGRGGRPAPDNRGRGETPMTKRHSSLLGILVESFLTRRLIQQQQASPATVSAYKDALRLLFRFASSRLGRPADQLDIRDLEYERVLAFLDFLEKERGTVCEHATRE